MTATEQFTWRMRAAAVGWLRYERGCYIVCWERSPWETSYRPDLIGVNRQRRVIEVEFKQSLSDLKSNESKPMLIQRNAFGYAPAQFYFAVPPSFVESAKVIIPTGAGLMTYAEIDSRFGPAVEIIRPARVNRSASALSMHAIARMVRHQTGTLHRACVAMARNGSTPRSDE